MLKDPRTLLQLFWSGALGVAPENIIGGMTSFSSSGIYRKRRGHAVFLFEHFASGSVVVNAPSSDVIELEKLAHVSFAELEAFLAREFKLEFDDYDFYLRNRSPSHLAPDPYRVSQMFENERAQLQLFLGTCSEDEVDTLDLSDDTLAEHIIVARYQEHIVGAGRYYVIPQTEVLTDLTLLTSSEHRNKGLAKAVLSELLENTLKEGLVPRYRVKTDNYSSIKVAESFGFEKFNRIRAYFPKDS